MRAGRPLSILAVDITSSNIVSIEVLAIVELAVDLAESFIFFLPMIDVSKCIARQIYN